MATRNPSLPPDLVPHPRYGMKPIPSGLRVPEETIRDGFWRHRGERMYPESVLVADTAKQNYSVFPRSYYVDVLRTCQTCERPFIFFAREQRHWFETLKFFVDADCVLCAKCRRESQAIRRRLRRYSDLQRRSSPKPAELKMLVDDAAYLFARGVLRDVANLGRLKNRAVKSIPDYAGTIGLRDALEAAKAARDTK
jgi:hypothetical protein